MKQLNFRADKYYEDYPWCPNNYEDKMEDERKSDQTMIKLISDSN